MVKRKYELSFWLKIGNDAFMEKLNNIFKELNLEIVKQNQLKENKLAYPIKKETTGLFGTIYFHGEPEKVVNLKEKLKNATEILRFIILRRVNIDES